MRMPDQLVLPIFPGPRFREADFCSAASNADACAWLRRTAEWPNHRLAIWGETGCGKTHLLHIWAERTGARFLAGTEVSGLREIPASGLVLDDADAFGDEKALLHLLNSADEARCPVLLAARIPPARWAVGLPDLASRLRAMTAVEIGPPEDELLRALLARLLTDCLFRPPEAVPHWLVHRLPRSAAAMHVAAGRLHAASLERHRNLTVPFAAEVLADMLKEDEISGTEGGLSQEGDALL